MFARVFRILTAVLGLTLLVPALQSPALGQSSTPQAGCRTFEQTGKTVCGKFLAYWDAHGGLAQQGYPISGEFSEVSDTNGKTYTVQYFERAEFELHPENQPPYDVLLSLLGTMRYNEKYPNGAPELPPPMSPVAGRYFAETGKEIRGVFLDYWTTHGGLAQQGYPISNLVSEKSDLDGKTYTVQYFQRAVFEMHPENQPPFNVLLSQLGTYRLKAKYPGGAPGNGGASGSLTGGTLLASGVWGGAGVGMNVTTGGATLEFDCAHASIAQPITLDANGKFSVSGTYVFEHGGPVAVGDDQGQPATFAGGVSGNTLTLVITVPSRSATIGPLTLGLGKQARIVKCV